MLVADGEKDLRVAVEHAADLMRIRGQSITLVQERFRFALEESFSAEGPSRPQRAALMVEDLDRESDLPVALVHDPRYARPDRKSVPVSFDDWGFCLAPGATLEPTEVAHIQRVLPVVQELAADRGHLVVRYFVATDSGLHAGFPAQGNFPEGYDARKRPWYGLGRRSTTTTPTPTSRT